MSLSAVRPLFQNVMKGLGFTEWRKSFEPENIPKTLTNSTFHIQTRPISGLRNNQNDQEINFPITLTFARNGFRDEVSAVEKCEELFETIIHEVLKPANRLKTAGIKNIVFNSATCEPIAVSNDNIILGRMEFTCFVILAP